MNNNTRKRQAGKSTKQWLPHFLPLVRPFRKQLWWAGLAMVLDAFLTVFRPWPLKVVIDRVLSHRPTRVPFLSAWLDNTTLSRMHVLYGACAATLLIALSTGLLTYAYTRSLGIVGQRFVFDLRCRLFAHMQQLSLRFHDTQRRGDLITRLTSDIQAIQDLVSNGLIVFGSNAFLLIGMLILMFWLNWQFAFVALAVAPLLFWTVFRYTHRIKVAARQARVSTGLLASLAQETLASIRIVQGLAQEEQQNDRFQAQSQSSLRSYLEGVRYQARVAPLVDVFAAVGLALVMWFGATHVIEGHLTTGDMVVFFAYVTNLYSPMKALSRLSYVTSKASVGAERIADIMGVSSEVNNRQGSREVSQLKGEIEFRDVSFEYQSGQSVLSRINLRIAPGEKIAIVGATGAGKSTLISLVPRLYDPSSGTVSIDAEDIRNYSVQSLRAQISLVLQDSLLFSGTIRENIAFGRPDASDKEIVAAAVVANVAEFIDVLPDGYETLVAEGGTTLSGGQKQRIAIARAILRGSPILILDEPTSGLDAASERTVIDALERAARGRTTLLIAHRLTTVRLADRIIVLDKGRIVEEGPHQELLSRRGKYAHLYSLQLAIQKEDILTLADGINTLE
ncbi:MAG TPA: ABC transporter ATP-binding protein [Terriglobales bacterium]|nr:ABC transporter ATP-binding protein [Terriglobales bacterium]